MTKVRFSSFPPRSGQSVNGPIDVARIGTVECPLPTHLSLFIRTKWEIKAAGQQPPQKQTPNLTLSNGRNGHKSGIRR